MQQQLFKVRDKRNKGWFWIENEYFNGFGRILGAGAIAVYVSLCRHANNNQKCFPSQKVIAGETKQSERKVRDIIKKLVEYRIVEITKERSRDGKWLNNVYWLLDKSEWIYPEAHNASGKPEANNDTARGKNGHSQRHVVPINNTNNNNTNKTAEQSSANLNELLDKFKKINPAYKKFFGNTTQRDALQRLVDEYGTEKVGNMIDTLPKINTMKYAPTITTPLQLEDKLGALIVFMARKKCQPIKIKI